MISLCFMFLKFSLIFFFWSAESTLGRYGDERVLDKPEVNTNSDKIAIWGAKNADFRKLLQCFDS